MCVWGGGSWKPESRQFERKISSIYESVKCVYPSKRCVQKYSLQHPCASEAEEVVHSSPKKGNQARHSGTCLNPLSLEAELGDLKLEISVNYIDCPGVAWATQPEPVLINKLRTST